MRTVEKRTLHVVAHAGGNFYVFKPLRVLL